MAWYGIVAIVVGSMILGAGLGLLIFALYMSKGLHW